MFKVGDVVQVEWLGGRLVICKITRQKDDRFEVAPLDYLSLEETANARHWVKATRIRAI